MRFLRFSPDKQNCEPSARRSAQESSTGQDSDQALVLARIIHGAGMAGLASFALDALKPLHWMGGQAMWIFQPFIAAVGTGSRRGGISGGKSGLSGDGIARLLERDGGLDELSFQLERLQSASGEDSGVQP